MDEVRSLCALAKLDRGITFARVVVDIGICADEKARVQCLDPF